MSVRVRNVAKGSDSKQLTIPAPLARIIPDGARFEAEFVDDGILFRFLGTDDLGLKRTVETPPWLQRRVGV